MAAMQDSRQVNGPKEEVNALHTAGFLLKEGRKNIHLKPTWVD